MAKGVSRCFVRPIIDTPKYVTRNRQDEFGLQQPLERSVTQEWQSGEGVPKMRNGIPGNECLTGVDSTAEKNLFSFKVILFAGNMMYARFSEKNTVPRKTGVGLNLKSCFREIYKKRVLGVLGIRFSPENYYSWESL